MVSPSEIIWNFNVVFDKGLVEGVQLMVFLKPKFQKKSWIQTFGRISQMLSLHLTLAFTRLLLRLVPLDDVGLDSLQGLDNAGL